MTAGSGAQTAYGVLGLHGMQLALPLTVLREVIPAPAELTRLPAVAPGFLGAVELRDRVIPVLDLGLALGQPSSTDRGQVIAVAVHEGRVVGLLAERVRGITTLAADALQQMSSDGGSLLFSEVFERPEDGSVCSLLDVPALFRMPGMPMLTEPSTGPGNGSEGSSGMFENAGEIAAPAAGRPVMMVRCGGIDLGFDAVDVHTVLPEVRLRPTPVQGGPCRGATLFGAQEIPVVDPLEVLGLGCLPEDDARQGILLRFEHGYVALMLSQVIDIVPVTAEDVMPVPALAVRRPEFFRGATSQPGGHHHLLVDVARLVREPDLIGLSACNTGPGTGPRPQGSGDEPAGGGTPVLPAAGAVTPPDGAAARADAGYARAGRTYLTYSIGVDVATPLEQIGEIIPFTAAQAVVGIGSGPVIGMMVHRRQALPVLDLAALLGFPRGTEQVHGSVLLVRNAGAQVGYLVQGLRAIEASVWEEDRDTGQITRGAAGGLSGRPLLQLGPAGQERMVAFVDLIEVGRDVFDDAGAEPAAPADDDTDDDPFPVGVPRPAELLPAQHAAARPAGDLSRS